jgi:hypothetical protein
MIVEIAFKEKVVAALMDKRERFDGSQEAFAKQYGINKAVFTRIKNGEREKLISDTQWLTLGRMLDVSPSERKWLVAKTDVFTTIEEDVNYCKEFSKSRILVDDVGIGKSFTAKYLSRTLNNCFYVDCKQANTKQRFIRLLAKTLGVEDKGRYTDVKENLKYYLRFLPKPMVIVDDSGYLEYNAYMELLELWDATEGVCGWYQIGDDSLREKLERGIGNKKVGYKAIFSRYSKRYTSIVPTDRQEKIAFYKKLIRDVLSVNMDDKSDLEMLVKKCLVTDDTNGLGDLRRAESLILLRKQNC